jgi:hypothetical protein
LYYTYEPTVPDVRPPSFHARRPCALAPALAKPDPGNISTKTSELAKSDRAFPGISGH